MTPKPEPSAPSKEAIQRAAEYWSGDDDVTEATVSHLAEWFDDFAARAVEAEREACAKTADAAQEIWSESCDHERMPAQEACRYVREVILVRGKGGGR